MERVGARSEYTLPDICIIHRYKYIDGRVGGEMRLVFTTNIKMRLHATGGSYRSLYRALLLQGNQIGLSGPEFVRKMVTEWMYHNNQFHSVWRDV